MATQGYARATRNRLFRKPVKGRAPTAFRRAFAAALLALPVLGWTMSAGTASDKVPRIEALVLNSYHDGFKWSDSVLNGIRRAFEAASKDVDLAIEHMDTKRHHDPDYFAMLSDFHARKFADRHFDVVMAVDNNAFEYVLDHRAELFPGVPVVFCGVKRLHPDLLRGQKNIAGVAEQGDWESTIGVALEPASEDSSYRPDQRCDGYQRPRRGADRTGLRAGGWRADAGNLAWRGDGGTGSSASRS